MNDATKALKINPDNTKAIIARGEALYSMGEFEKGLVQFERGWRSRQDPKMKIGLQKCKDAVSNAVGPNGKEFDIDLVQRVMESLEIEKNGGKTRYEDPIMLSKKKIMIQKREKRGKAKED